MLISSPYDTLKEGICQLERVRLSCMHVAIDKYHTFAVEIAELCIRYFYIIKKVLVMM